MSGHSTSSSGIRIEPLDGGGTQKGRRLRRPFCVMSTDVDCQCPQLLQCPPAQPEQPALEVLLATILLPPPASRLMAANTDKARCTASEPHLGHAIGASI